LEDVTPDMAARGVETAFGMLEGRWKMVIIFHLFARGTHFSELEKAIPGISQKMLIQQLREPSATASSDAPSTRKCRRRLNAI
jgi:DNA-binding HxlR family transcriptional regulator